MKIIHVAYDLLYVLLFISLIVVMGYFHVAITFTFLGSVLALLLPVIFSKDVFEKIEEFEAREECTLLYIDDQK